MSDANANVHGPVFDRARIGPVSTDYPDLVLAAVLGVRLSSWHKPFQSRALLAMTLIFRRSNALSGSCMRGP